MKQSLMGGANGVFIRVQGRDALRGFSLQGTEQTDEVCRKRRRARLVAKKRANMFQILPKPIFASLQFHAERIAVVSIGVQERIGAR